MASKQAIAGVLAYLHELYPSRAIGQATAEAWSLTFADWPDDELQVCARAAAASPGRSFFPTPGEVAAFRVERMTPIVDAGKLLRQIEKLGTYSPTIGYQPPTPSTVRAALGDVIADAYATAGGHRCFSDEEMIRSIAYREFQKAATEYAALPDGVRPLLESGQLRPRLKDRNAQPESLAGIIGRALPAGEVA